MCDQHACKSQRRKVHINNQTSDSNHFSRFGMSRMWNVSQFRSGKLQVTSPQFPEFRVLLTIFCLLAVLSSCYGTNAKIPLVSDDLPETRHHEPGCSLDGKLYTFGERWSPVLIPQGKMHCVKCECLPVEKKGIIQPEGEVKCRNIKNMCPKPTCDEPVLLPDRCCKSCPGTDNDMESNFTFRPANLKIGDIYSYDQHDHQQVNEFQALLVGKNVRRHPVMTSSVAVIYFTMEKGELRYSVKYSKLDRPKFLQITDSNGSILFEKPIVKQRTGEKKLCGIWRKVPALYMQYFRQERLFAVITTSKYPDGLVVGRVIKNEMASTEILSAILSPPTANGCGGIVTFDYDQNTRLLKYVIHVDGIGQSGIRREYQVAIYKGSKVLHQSSISAVPQISKVTGAWKLSKKRDRKHLTKGRLRVRVSHNNAIVIGVVEPKLTCGIFQAVLSSSNALEKQIEGSAGSAIFELRESGGLDYKIRIAGLESKLTKISIENAAGKRKRKIVQKTVGNLHKTFVAGNGSFSGWANGTFKTLELKDMWNLLNNRLFINVATVRHPDSELRGRLLQTSYHEHYETTTIPTTLLPFTPEARGSAAHAWLSMDMGCALRYDVVMAGSRHRNDVEDLGATFSVELSSHENRLHRTVLLGPSGGNEISSLFEYHMSSGSISDLSESTFRDLDQSLVFLQITSGTERQAIFRGNVTLPNTCWQYDTPKDGPPPVIGDRCYFEGVFFNVGDSWLPDVNATCYTCSCMQREQVVCHALACPPLKCDNPVKLDTECCPTCPEESWSQTCSLDKDPRRYPLHRTWYPFLPLTGFARCVTCTCKAGGSPVCDRVACPKLNCPGHEHIKAPEDCCPVCGPKVTKDISSVDRPQLDVNMDGACNFMGELKADGASWHPRVKPFGYMKCFVCACNTGEFSCGRIKCPKLTCKRKIRKSQSCCDECSPNQPTENEIDKKEIGNNQGCTFGGKFYNHQAQWRPPASPEGDARCARCRCKNGIVKCKIRCPKKCAVEENHSPCCRHCDDLEKDQKKNSNSSTTSGPQLIDKVKARS